MLKGSNVTIRTIREADLSLLADLSGDIEGQGDYLPTSMVSEASLRNEYNKSGFITESWSRYVVLDRNGSLVGMTWAFKSVPYFDALEIGYHIFRKEERGKGYATAAVKLLVEYLFDAKPVNRLEIRVAAGNTASAKVAAKAGFVLEGTHRQAAFSKGKFHDMQTFALLRKDRSASDGAHSKAHDC